MPPIMHVPFIEDPLRNLRLFIVPSIVLGLAMAGGTMRMTRTMMLEVLRQGLYQDGLGKGAHGEGGHPKACPEECTNTSNHYNRTSVPYPAWRRGYYRADICATRDGSPNIKPEFCTKGIGGFERNKCKVLPSAIKYGVFCLLLVGR